MIVVAITLFCIFAAATILQVLPTLQLRLQFSQSSADTVQDDELPKAAILMALRGADPDLVEGLKGFMRQDYPNYELHIVIDSEQDPAWAVVQQAIEETSAANVKVEPLHHRPTTCSLHCSSLVQLASGLDDSIEIFALADGDVSPHSTWLRDLVEPITRGDVDATFGLRWYAPRRGHFGSVLRYVVTAIGLPAHFGDSPIPWGGTFAGRVTDLHRSGIVDKWKRSLAVDAPLQTAWGDLGLTMRAVPSLVVVNDEECRFTGVMTFLARQLTWSRLYHPFSKRLSWMGTAAVSLVAVLAAVGILLYGVFSRDWAVIAWTAGGLMFAWFGLIFQVAVTQRAVRGVLGLRGHDLHCRSPVIILKLLLACALSPFTHIWTACLAVFRRQITWRGVTYQIHSRDRVTKVDDAPFEQSGKPADANVSL